MNYSSTEDFDDFEDLEETEDISYSDTDEEYPYDDEDSDDFEENESSQPLFYLGEEIEYKGRIGFIKEILEEKTYAVEFDDLDDVIYLSEEELCEQNENYYESED